MALRRRFGFGSRGRASTRKNHRIYVIGDVHGRMDLLSAMLARIQQHVDSRQQAKRNYLVMLGDLVDRGPASSRVLQFLFRVQSNAPSLIVLRGNHEEVMLRALSGDISVMRAWMRMGGDATLRSFGIEPPSGNREIVTATAALGAALSSGMLDWLRAMPLTARSGDYLFCHAGIRPGVSIKQQTRTDLLWIREDFLEDATDHGLVVVHGHSVSAEAEIRDNRIGIDTGAYCSGRLTALCLEGEGVEILTVLEDEL